MPRRIALGTADDEGASDPVQISRVSKRACLSLSFSLDALRVDDSFGEGDKRGPRKDPAGPEGEKREKGLSLMTERGLWRVFRCTGAFASAFSSRTHIVWMQIFSPIRLQQPLLSFLPPFFRANGGDACLCFASRHPVCTRVRFHVWTA